MKKLLKILFIVVVLQGFLWAAAQKVEMSRKFDTPEKREIWWNGLDYQWKLAFNRVLGLGKTVQKPKDVFLESLLKRKTLFLYGHNLTDVSGLSQLDHLENVNCSYNQIADLNGIENLVNLKELKLSDNRIQSLWRLRNLKKLEYLRADFNDLQDLRGLEDLQNLKRVYVHRNFISSIEPLANKPLLEELSINHNNISSLEPLSSSPKLKILLAHNNEIANIKGLENAKDLEKIFIFKNKLTNLDGVEKLKSLKVFLFSEDSKTLPESEKQRVSALFTEKRNTKILIIGGVLGLLILILVSMVSFKFWEKWRLRKEKRREFLRLRKLFATQNASFFDSKKLLRQWWNNLEPQWKRAFNVQLDNGYSLFLPNSSELRELVNSNFFRIQAENLTNLSGLQNCTKLERLSFYDETPEFLQSFVDLTFLGRFRNLKKIEFSTDEIKKVESFANLSKMFKIVIASQDIPYTPKGSIVDITQQTSLRYKYPIVAIGNFEGLHFGHSKLLNRLYSRATDTGGEALVLTYRAHTREHFLKMDNRPIEPYMILERKHKEHLLFHKFGVHSILYLDFDEVAHFTAEEFFKKILLEKLHIREIVCGHDTRFGKGKEGDYRLLMKLGKPYGIKVRLVDPLIMSGEIVCSKLIREKIKKGEINGIRRYLSRNYSVVGTVEKGRKIGGSLGFPTLNLSPKEEFKIYPAEGVYITHTKIGDKGYYGLTNIGFAPTVRSDERKKTIENYLYKFNKNIYGREVKVEFLRFLRAEKKFASQAELMAQLKKDLEALKQYIRVH